MPEERFVIDTSAVISGLIRSASPSRAFFHYPPGALFAPAALFDELSDHHEEIARKAKLAAAKKVFGKRRKTIPLVTLQKELGLVRKTSRKSVQRKSGVQEKVK